MTEPTPDEGSLAARLVREFLRQQGLPRHKHAPWLAETLGITYTTALRRLTGPAAWVLEDLETVAKARGATLSSLLEGVTQEGAVAAIYVHGPLQLPCKLWPGPPVRPGAAVTGSLVALPASACAEGSQAVAWQVVPATLPLPPNARHVQRVCIEPRLPTARRIAVLDDSPGSAHNLALGLNQEGFHASAFTSLDAIRNATAASPFDAYVSDWLLSGGETAAELVLTVRQHQPQAPILVLTGQLDTGAIDDTALMAAARDLRLDLIEKPARPQVIALRLDLALSSQTSGTAPHR